MWGVLRQEAATPVSKASCPSVSYGPFEGRRNPGREHYPNAEKIRADLKTLAPLRGDPLYFLNRRVDTGCRRSPIGRSASRSPSALIDKNTDRNERDCCRPSTRQIHNVNVNGKRQSSSGQRNHLPRAARAEDRDLSTHPALQGTVNVP